MTEARPISLKIVVPLLAFLIVAVYAWTIHAGFHFDDGHTISENAAMRNWGSLKDVWTDERVVSVLAQNRSYRPLLFTQLFLAFQAGGGAPWPFHVVKMLMHLGICVGMFLMWRRLYKGPAWLPGGMPEFSLPGLRQTFTFDSEKTALLLAILFAVHPAATECVVYISASSSLQAAVCYVWAFIAYLKWRNGGGRRYYVFTLLLYVASVFSKEEGITFPVVVALYELMAPDRAWKKAAKAVLPFGALMLLLAFLFSRMHPDSQLRSLTAVTPTSYFITQWRAYLWYMRLWFWPFDLNADNVGFEFSRTFADVRVQQALIGNLLLLAVAVWNRRVAPAFFFGLLWFYITIAPASSFIPLTEPVNERRMFLSYVGFTGGTLPFFLLLLAKVTGSTSPVVRARVLGGILAALIVALGTGAYLRSRVWLDDRTLWEDTLEKNPESGRAMNNLALTHMRVGEMTRAIELLENCERVWPRYAYCVVNRAISLAFIGRNEEAKAAFEKAMVMDPENAEVHFRYGEIVEKYGDLPRAAIEFAAADSLSGGVHLEGKYRGAKVLIKLGDRDKAGRLLKDLERLAPRDPRTLEVKALLGTP